MKLISFSITFYEHPELAFSKKLPLNIHYANVKIAGLPDFKFLGKKLINNYTFSQNYTTNSQINLIIINKLKFCKNFT